MKKITYKFSSSKTDFYLDSSLAQLPSLVDKANAVLITDEKVFFHHASKLKGWNVVVLKSGEEHKTQETVDAIIDNLIEIEADRKTTLVGIGGGVITDITGFAASIYMRGLNFGFVPSTLLGMVDAAIGGKNGIDVGVYKNMVGTIRQPSFLLYDYGLLKTLPDNEWSNGFAEIIKHACIKDASLFNVLERTDISKFKKNKKLTAEVAEKNIRIKCKIVMEDEFEKGDRKLLNFGHTLGHALEKVYSLAHGQAISLGMVAAAEFSEDVTGFRDTQRVIDVLDAYGLPTDADFDKKKVFEILKKDKKKVGNDIDYVMLEKIGKGKIHPIPMGQLEQFINQL